MSDEAQPAGCVPGTTALVLAGGGARAAYQVGVLKAIAELLPDPAVNPFPVICGTSAGAINALALASNAGDFANGIQRLNTVWANFRCNQVYRSDWPGVVAQAMRWTGANLMGIGRRAPTSLLDNRPLRHLLEKHLHFGKIQGALNQGHLQAISVSAFGYQSAESVCFYQAHERIKPWSRHRRVGIQTQLGIDHMMASAAIPLLFMPVRIGREWFGDGAVRQRAPISPALHLGADRVLVIGLSDNLAESVDTGQRARKVGSVLPPTLAQMGGHLLNSTFVDNLESDLELLERMNRLASFMPEDARQHGKGLLPVEVMIIAPSEPLDLSAARHRRALPSSLRTFLRGSGATRASGGSVLSYLLFEAEYCQELIALGYRDATAKREELQRFLGLLCAVQAP